MSSDNDRWPPTTPDPRKPPPRPVPACIHCGATSGDTHRALLRLEDDTRVCAPACPPDTERTNP